MKIWYINHYSPGSNNPTEGRAFLLAKGLVENGSYCAVIGASFHHLMRSKGKQTELFRTKDVDGVPFVWLKTPSYQGNGFGRLKNMFSFAFKCFKIDFFEKCNLEKPDVIIISSAHPFHFFAGLRWAKKFDAKLVFEVRDLWPLSLNMLLGVSKYHPLSIFVSFLERLAYRKSDLIVSLLPNALDYMSKYGVHSKRFTYIPNGYSNSLIASNKCVIESDLTDIRSRYRLVIMHTGSMGLPNGLEMLVNIANDLSNNSEVSFVFIGDGGCKENLKEMSMSKHIYFFDPIPKNQVNCALKYADICYCGSQENLEGLYKYGVSPNKIFDYMAAEKFILFVVDSINTPVDLGGCGIRYSPSDIDGIKSFICKSILVDKMYMREAGLAGKKYLEEKHNFTFLAKSLLNKLSKI